MSKIVSVVDIGTSKILTLVTKFHGGNFELLGYASLPSKGISRGSIVDVEEASLCIDSSIKEAEKTAGLKISSVRINISGSHIKSVTSSSAMTISKYPREIRDQDKERLQNLIQDRVLEVDRSIIHRIAYNYRVDDGSVMKNPSGMIGCKLNADVHIVTGVVNAVESLVKCVKDLGIRVDGVVISSLSSAEACLSEVEKKMGTLVIDSGAGTTDIAIIRNNKLVHTAVVPIGGEHFSNDIAAVLNVDLKTAEYLKKNLASMIDQEYIEVSNYGSSDIKKIRVGYLKSVVDARIEELVDYIYRSVERTMPFVRNGIVLTGGVAKLFGYKEFLEDRFKMSVRIGVPSFNKLNTPEFSTAVGMVVNRSEFPSSESKFLSIFNRFITFRRFRS